MQTLTDQHSVGRSAQALRHLNLRLRSKPGLEAVRTAIDTERKKLLAADEAWQAARDERIAQTAEVGYRDDCVDSRVMRLSRAHLVVTDGKASDPRYRRVFPIAPSEATRDIAGDSQSRYVAHVVSAVRAQAETPEIAELAEAVAEDAKALDESVKQRDELYVAELTARTNRVIALGAAQRFYNRQYAQLLVAFPDEERWVESCFLDMRRSYADEDPTDAMTAEPAMA